ncbi:MAG: hypothetical protein J1F05_06955 [Muribaculaceae bacterium]|nr:hypothetical protein [Muribaculaceae bacterium]
MRLLSSAHDLEERVLELGFLPFFRNSIAGFSVEEMSDPDLWFVKDLDGPWEWKGPVIRRRKCAYGKFFGCKTMYISLEWFADFVNWRRASRPLISGSEGKLGDTTVLNAIEEFGSMLSPDLKRLFEALPRRKRTATDLVDLTGLGDVEYKVNRNALERSLTSLQMGTHIVIEDFEYAVSKTGKEFGWGLARYNTPENLFGEDFVETSKGRTPVESYRLMYDYLTKLLPSASGRQIASILK